MFATSSGHNSSGYYDWLTCHKAYVSQWDAQRNVLFREMHPVIRDGEYLIWYMSITRRVIIPDLE
ncbi:hypothetical protein BDE02_04G147100 [Populus trichocarpa]|nr:hypothetical protein BDE02_04G147100 [Populus trichocarpa]